VSDTIVFSEVRVKLFTLGGKVNRKNISWRVAVPPEVSTEYAGTRLGAYYTDGETMLRTQLTARSKFQDMYGITPIGIGADTPAYLGVAVLGAELVFPEDDPPMVRGHPLRRVEDIDRLKIPDRYYETEIAAPYLRIYEYIRSQVGDRVHLGVGIEGPVTSAKLLRGQDFFLDLYDHPEAAHRLLDIVTESIIRFTRENRRIRGLSEESGGTGIADDFSGLISPEMYAEFVAPYHRRIYDAFGEAPRSLHSELLRREHLRYLAELGVTHFDPGQDQYLTVRDIVESTDVPFTANVYTVRDMQQGTPESVAAVYRRAVEEGASSVMVELCRNTPPDNIRAFIEVAKEYE